MNVIAERPQATGGLLAVRRLLLRWFLAVGVVPLLLVVLIVVFAIMQPRFLSSLNLLNMGRQSTYLIIATLGQMLYLLTRNYDLSNGACIGLTTVVTATVMTWHGWGDNTAIAIAAGCAAGVMVGVLVGLLNGVVVAVFKITSFIVTLGTASILLGIALLISKGAPVSGMPDSFVEKLGTGKLLGLPVPLYITAVVVVLFYFVLNWTRLGRYTYAIGGNAKASHVSGIGVRRYTIVVLVIGSTLAALVGVMLTARLSSGESNVGADMPLQTIAAAALGGVSLFGGEGRLLGAVIGAVFIIVVGNGMDLIHVNSYVQEIVIGALLIIALVVDRARVRLQKSGKA